MAQQAQLHSTCCLSQVRSQFGSINWLHSSCQPDAETAAHLQSPGLVWVNIRQLSFLFLALHLSLGRSLLLFCRCCLCEYGIPCRVYS